MIEDSEEYDKAFTLLQQAVVEAEINIHLHKGCEVRCAAEYMDDIIYGLDEGIFATLGESNYVLTELYPDAKPSEAIQIINALTNHGYNPIIAHMERNFNITGPIVGTLIESGALIQVNAFSFYEKSNEQYHKRAKELLKNQHIHFVGSDAHRINHRSPKIDSGIQFILSNAEQEYALDILYRNAERYLGVDSVQAT